jgi:mediator of RNA polymerase II transcription subunit 17
MSGPAALSDVALRPWPAPKKDELKPEELKGQIAQLTGERGHLRDITEKSLQDEIIAGKDVTDSAAEQSDKKAGKKETQSREQRKQEVVGMQFEMCQELECASYIPKPP